MSFKRILCAVDFSPRSNQAFDEAVQLAQANKAKLFILHAIEVQPLASGWFEPDGLSDLTLQVEEKAKQSLEALQNSVADQLAKLSVHSEITSGRAFTEILENARVWDADLIVMGGTGFGALEDLPLGSTVNRVLNEADCSVLVVKNGG
ncbi:MAG: universal stress protein [Acidobacteriota bacterium]|nr:MAG: universal stress protein [Acidobacteriota bacterium]